MRCVILVSILCPARASARSPLQVVAREVKRLFDSETQCRFDFEEWLVALALPHTPPRAARSTHVVTHAIFAGPQCAGCCGTSSCARSCAASRRGSPQHGLRLKPTPGVVWLQRALGSSRLGERRVWMVAERAAASVHQSVRSNPPSTVAIARPPSRARAPPRSSARVAGRRASSFLLPPYPTP